jgi:hypothetical protein
VTWLKMFDPYAWGLSCHFTRLMGKACPVAQWPRESRGSEFVAGKNPCKMHITQMHMSAPALHSLVRGVGLQFIAHHKTLCLVYWDDHNLSCTCQSFLSFHSKNGRKSGATSLDWPPFSIWCDRSQCYNFGLLVFPFVGYVPQFKLKRTPEHVLHMVLNDVNFFGHRNGRLKNMVTSL